MLEIKRFRALALEYGIELTNQQAQQLDEYARLLVEWNKKINLTAITQPEEIEIKHFLDSLLLAAQPEVAGSLVDVGSGAGFPGMVAKIYRPALQVTLMEPTGKRVTFLQEVAAQLGLDITTVKERAEEAARKQWREKYPVATARAVAALPVLCEYCLPLVQVGGCFIAMKGKAQPEAEEATNALTKLGGEIEAIRQYNLPDGADRSLIIVRKTRATPAVYPRNGGVIAKKPL